MSNTVAKKVKHNQKIIVTSLLIQSKVLTTLMLHIERKGNQKTKGYSTNITEIVLEVGEMLGITDIQVKNATGDDNDFLRKSVPNTEDIAETKIETIFADGAYHSEFEENNNITLYTCSLQGKESRYMTKTLWNPS